jgi:hypothetical protein
MIDIEEINKLNKKNKLVMKNACVLIAIILINIVGLILTQHLFFTVSTAIVFICVIINFYYAKKINIRVNKIYKEVIKP